VGKEVEVIAEADVEVVVLQEAVEPLVEEEAEQRAVRRPLWYVIYHLYVTHTYRV
jgi:hypothetical protein